MFKSQNFCHIASNNRNQVKVGVFVYRTTDSLATVSASGYFNDRIIDINLHDLIIHEKVDSADATKVQRNLLCVTERSLENVGTTLIKSKWEGDIEQAIADLQTYVDSHFVKLDGTSVMTGPLLMRATPDFKCAVAPYWDGIGFFKLNDNNSVTLMASLEYEDGLTPATDNKYNLGTSTKRWKDARIARIITATLNNGYDIAVPVTNSADTLALKSEVDLAANSGRMITDQGVWYAKMYAATVAPSAENGTNYADFSQVDGQGNPIIVIYERTNGAWVQSETITPPAEYDGYVPITSKIWDITEQAGQQGGRILWNHQSKEFTPYPQIISFEDAALTGTPTAPSLTVSSPNDQIVNKQSLESALINHGTGRNVGDIFFTARTDNALHGSVECNGNTYNTTDFTGAESIGQLLEDGKVPYMSLADYATELTTNGSVGVFGWDGIGTTAFRVPSLNDIFIETGTSAQIGDYLSAGLPNITGQLGFSGNYRPPFDIMTGAFAQDSTGYSRDSDGGGDSDSTKVVSFDASRSSSIYGGSATVQPKAVRYRAMVQLMISASDEALATCTSVASQVASNTAAINGADYVIESQLPTAQNNYTWYRKYKSGWVEQGGLAWAAGGGWTNVNLPIEMADTKATINVSVNWSTTGQDGLKIPTYYMPSTTKIGILIHGRTGQSGLAFYPGEMSWQVSGMAA